MYLHYLKDVSKYVEVAFLTIFASQIVIFPVLRLAGKTQISSFMHVLKIHS